jgi:hypothetical protein
MFSLPLPHQFPPFTIKPISKVWVELKYEEVLRPRSKLCKMYISHYQKGLFDSNIILNWLLTFRLLCSSLHCPTLSRILLHHISQNHHSLISNHFHNLLRFLILYTSEVICDNLCLLWAKPLLGQWARISPYLLVIFHPLTSTLFLGIRFPTFP